MFNCTPAGRTATALCFKVIHLWRIFFIHIQCSVYQFTNTFIRLFMYLFMYTAVPSASRAGPAKNLLSLSCSLCTQVDLCSSILQKRILPAPNPGGKSSCSVKQSQKPLGRVNLPYAISLSLRKSPPCMIKPCPPEKASARCSDAPQSLAAPRPGAGFP